MKASLSRTLLISAPLLLGATASAQETAKPTYDSFADCYNIISQIDQEGLLRFMAEEQDVDVPTFGLFTFTNQGDVEQNLNTSKRGNVTNFGQVNGMRELTASRSQRMGVPTDLVEHYFTYTSGKISSMYVTGKLPKGHVSDGNSNRWGLNFTFKTDPASNTCVLTHVTIGTEDAPKAYQPKNGAATSEVAFDLKGCQDFLTFQADHPNAQYCKRVVEGSPMALDGISSEEVMRLQNSGALVGGGMPSSDLVSFCKTYPSSNLERTFNHYRASAGDLCPPLGSTDPSAVIRYVLNYTVTHRQAPVGSNSTSGSIPPSGSTSTVNPTQ